ncbi:putative NADP-dependent oxidoreductase [Candidatus Nitrososphaera evergladensis SR1]|uniref:Putative NADP-dependent oxidoreductase n=1 Tax=Candidatus Nitrososphaera evergladensis SR1 TaxID=1459636 RepID=A0A075MLU5_9ARCH|nr:NADP-dependent oxidoreductase [Candidatus Nitrososphaera evergladensis]AIF82110.1 putative NADP-dependent oxidoreductase [Candidatus Nitrososphaera evergladensis SR1]
MKSKIVSKEIHLKKRPAGFVTEDDFELVEVEIPEPKREGEFSVRNIWMSVDPWMRIYMVKGSRIMPPVELNKALSGGCIGQVIESKSDNFKVGECVKANFGWREYWAAHDADSSAKNITKVDPKIAPLEYFLGLLGITGITAYVGLFKIGELREGQDTVFVSSAAGGVGSVACQIAKIKGCHVVGSCGSDEKVRWLLDELKVDYAFNYRKLGESNISSELKRACPDGIDLYFDNVGGKHLEAAIDNMNIFGRIVLCGTTSQYNDNNNTSTTSGNVNDPSTPTLSSGPSNLSLAVSHRLRLQGFIWSDHNDILNEFNASMSKWINEGRIKWKESIFEGLENAPKAFVSLFKGESLGRMLVKLGPYTATSL